MNFSVYNTQAINNIPESGIFTTYRSNFDGTTLQNSMPIGLVVDNEYIYYPSPEISYISKNIGTVAILNTNGDIISRVEPNCTQGGEFYFVGKDNNYIYCGASVGFSIKDNATQNNSIFRINKNTYKIDKDFMLGGWYNWNSRYMATGNNKYYFHTASNISSFGIYPNLDSNGLSAGIFILKNKINISKLGRLTNTFNKIKIKDNDIYVAGRTPHRDAVNSFSKIFRINKNLQIDESFYPIIERLNSTSALVAGAVSSDVFDFDFDNQGIYIGGNFLTINGEIRTGLAKIDYSGNLISGFNANLSASNNLNIVRAVLTTGSGLFVGGTMANVGDSIGINARIVKLHNDGSLNTGFSGRLNINNATCLAISGDSLYAGASLNSPFGGGLSYGIAKMSAENGSIDTNFQVDCGLAGTSPFDVTKILVSGDNLYVSAAASFNPYTNLNNSLQHFATGVVKIRAFDGNPDTGFKINFSPHLSTPTIQDMFIKGNELHIVGAFTGIEGRRINNYAVVDTISGKLLDTYSYFLDPNNLRTIGYKSDNDLVILGGGISLSNIYTSTYNYNYNSRINVFDSNFNLLTGIQFGNIPLHNTSNTINQMLINGTTGYINSGSLIYATNTTNFVRAFNLEDGSVLSTNVFNLSGNNGFSSMVRYGNNFYFGGYFDSVAGIGFTGNRVGIIKTDINGVIDTSFNLNLTGGIVNPASLVSNIKIIDNNLYVFSAINIITGALSTGVNGGMVKYNLLTNTLDTGFNDFLKNQPLVRNVHNDSQNNLYFVFAPNSNTEYTGSRGYFENSGHLFKFNSGSYIPNNNFNSKYFWLLGDIDIDNDKIFAPLRNTNKISGSNIYKINKKTREISSSKVSILGNSNTTNILTMYGNNNSLYVAGAFTGVNGMARTGVCKLNKSDLSLDTSFNLNIGQDITTEFVTDILETDNHIYFHGNFTTVSGIAHTGICRINKNNDAWDQSFKVNYSGLNLASTIRNAVISGNKLYNVTATTRNFRILNLDTASLEFTGNASAVPSTAILYGIENANGNLFIVGSTSTTLTNTALIGGRGRGMFIASYNSGNIISPYSIWGGQDVSRTYFYPEYISANNSIGISTLSTTALINNAAQRSTTSTIFFDANKGFIKNKRGINWVIGAPSFFYSSIHQINKNEIYMIYNNYLLNNPEDNLYTFITNTSYSRGIIKYDPIKERYDIII